MADTTVCRRSATLRRVSLHRHHQNGAHLSLFKTHPKRHSKSQPIVPNRRSKKRFQISNRPLPASPRSDEADTSGDRILATLSSLRCQKPQIRRRSTAVDLPATVTGVGFSLLKLFPMLLESNQSHGVSIQKQKKVDDTFRFADEHNSDAMDTDFTNINEDFTTKMELANQLDATLRAGGLFWKQPLYRKVGVRLRASHPPQTLLLWEYTLGMLVLIVRFLINYTMDIICDSNPQIEKALTVVVDHMEGPDPVLDPGKGFFRDVNGRIRVLSYHNMSDYEAKALLVQRKKLLTKRLMFGLVGMLTMGTYFYRTHLTNVKIKTVATTIAQERVDALKEENEMKFKVLEARLTLLESMKFVLGGTNLGSKYGQAIGGGLPYGSLKKDGSGAI